MEKFLNISNHILTDEQIKDLKIKFNSEVEVIELPEYLKKVWSNLNPINYQEVCDEILLYMEMQNIKHAHLAGFTPAVVSMCINASDEYTGNINKFKLYYFYSERVPEEKEINGEIIKTSVFKHRGWYEY